MTRINVTLHEELCIFVIESRRILFRIGNISDKFCKENQNTNFMVNNYFPENRAVCEIMWKSMVEWGRSKVTIK
jgi:hypothetical protein